MLFKIFFQISHPLVLFNRLHNWVFFFMFICGRPNSQFQHLPFLTTPKEVSKYNFFYSHKSVIFCGRVYLQKYNLPCDIFVCQTLRDGGRTICNYEERVRRERGRELSFMQGSTFKNRIFLEVCFFSEN